MKELKPIALLLLILLTSNSEARDNPDSSTLLISFGANHIVLKDAFVSPYTFKGNSFLFHIVHVYIKPTYIRVVDLSSTSGKIRPEISPMAKHSLLNLNFYYLYRLQEIPSNLSISVGGGVNAFYNTLTYLPEIELPDRYITWSASLTVSGRMSWYVNKKNRLGLDLRLPVIGLSYRPDFEVDGRDYLGMNSIFTNAEFSGMMEIEHRLTLISD